MKRIIDVDENLICEGFVRNFTEEEKDVLINAIRYSIPYEERPQGEWIENVERRGRFAGDKTVYSYTCPFCKVKEFKKYPFCHCGADMRKGGAE